MLTGILIAATLTMIGSTLGLLLLVRRSRATLMRARSELGAAGEARESEAARWQATLRGMPDGLMVLDADLRLVEWNQHFPDCVGVQVEILRKGMPVADILRAQALAGEFGPVDVEAEVRRRVADMRAGLSTGTIERKRPNGRTMELRRSPLAEGGFVTLYTDITARRRAEDQLRQAQKMEAIGQLTGGIAHDFNNLLTVVMGNIEIAQNALQASNPLRAQSKLEEARAGAERGAILTRRLLAYSRRQTLEPRPVNVNKIVANMSELIRSSIGRLSLETVLAGELWDTIIDPNQLENALLNLAINARDAMPDGGKITLETANANLDAAYAAAHSEVSAGQYVLVAVSDGGEGMSPEAMERAFEPFFTTKGVGKGSGLGLSQVFGFIKQSKGHVKIYSEIGLGTTVKLYLPRFVVTPVAGETIPSPAELPHAQDHETILVVEDDVDVLAYMQESLEGLGYHVIAARDAQSALTSLATHPNIALLFTDVQLPELTGPSLAEEIERRRPGLPVLYTTAYPAMAVLHRGLLAREVRTITKPFVLAELAAAVRDAIDNPRASTFH
jgi:signal transduction histidine kinase/ActR/RegA family two-component response regulator